MGYPILEKSLDLLFKRQTNILSAAFVIMATVIFSQILGVIRYRLLTSVFGVSNTVGVYLVASRLPDFLFQLIFAGALASAFIPVFSEFLGKRELEKANKMASTLLLWSIIAFIVFSLPLIVFAPFFLNLTINLGSHFSPSNGFTASQISLMAQLMRVITIGQLLFIFGTFFSAVLQSHNHFFIPGLATALNNLGIIIGIVTLSSFFGIFAAAYGIVIGATLFALIQIPSMRKVNFTFFPSLSLKVAGVSHVIKLMGPRTLSAAIFQIGSLLTLSLVSFLPSAGRNYLIYDYAQTLAFAPVLLFGQSIAQAAFPVLSRERERLLEFKATFLTSFNQMLYLILPISALFLVLRIPIVRLIFGSKNFDWEATVLIGTTIALFAVSMFAQGLQYLIYRGFYALHDTKTPLTVGTITTILMLVLGFIFVWNYHFGIQSIALAYSIGSIVNIIILMIFLHRKTQGFDMKRLFIPVAKIFTATCFTGLALYIPIKLLDRLVFDTTRTINLLMLTGISSSLGLALYLFLTWLFNVEEATLYIGIFRKLGNWRDILKKQKEIIDPTRGSL